MARVDLGNDWWELSTGDSAEIETHVALIAGLQQQASSAPWVELARVKNRFALTGRFVKQELAALCLASFVGGAGATWEVRLYNVTDAAELVKITVTATAITCQRATFSLPFAEKEVSIEARQTVGGAQPINITHALICWSSVL
ncbi:hypothetical protein LCGC14_0800300 [marine sediment metagenome]|uniref:Uncharacterized protein n=1 Tax=marine sediment metagenome TaxID=412755 RepID=A0A0F9S9W3_9ZZZZ